MTNLIKKIRSWTRPWDTGASPMEIRRAVLDELESKVVAVGRGKKILPYQGLLLHLLAEGPEQQIVLETAIREGWELESSIRERMKALGAADPVGLSIDYKFHQDDLPEFGGRRYFLEFGPGAGDPFSTEQPILEIRVTRGTAAKEIYRSSASRFYIGRLEEVLDRQGRLERRNNLAFAEEGGINASVSRKHASIRYDEADRTYHLRDDNSAAGTRVFREGRPIRVASHRQGVRLFDGDEVSLGKAQVVVRIRNE